MSWLWWAPLAAAVLHIIEEFFFPGGFPAWDRAYRPDIASSITPRFHFWINALLLVLCAMVGIAGTESGAVDLGGLRFGSAIGPERAVAAWLTIAALLFSNAIFHVVGTFQTRQLSPGLRTALALYVPLAILGYAYFLRTGQVSVATAIVSALLGGSYHLWAAILHARRARHFEGEERS